MSLKFAPANAKLKELEKKVGGKVYSFSMLSGHTCPYAKECLSKVETVGGRNKIVDGPHTRFRCFTASQEVMFPTLYKANKHNTDVIRATGFEPTTLAKVISEDLPSSAKAIRIHVGGDFRNQQYFDAWMIVAKEYSDKIFYAYTKSLPFWIKRLKELPDNLILTASRGGHRDNLIREYRLRQAVVISDSKTVNEIVKSENYNRVPCGRYKGWDIDHDDSHAALPELKDKSFALLVHNIQPANSDANKSLQLLKSAGSHNAYSR